MGNYVVPIAFLLIVLILVGGVVVGILARKRGIKKYQELLRQGSGWRQVPANPQLWQQVHALRSFASSRGLKDFFHMAGDHRGMRFEVVQYQRPPGLGERTFTAGVAVFLPRPVPGPSLQFGHSGFWSRLGQDLIVPTGNPEFDRSFLLTSPDADFTRAAMQPGLVDGLLRDNRMKSCVVEFAPEHLVVFAGKTATKDTVLPMLDMLIDIHGNVPWQALTRP